MWTVLLLSLAVVAPAAAPDRAKLDAYVSQKLDESLVRGAGVLVIRDGAVVYGRAFGEAERGRPMTLDTPMIVGSLSKAFTATAVLQLVDEGRVALDQPVRSYLPEFALADSGAAASITVRELLNQTSGIPTHAPRANDDDASLEDHVRALAAVQPVAPRGERHIYSSPGYQVLGLLVERVSGLPFGEYVEQRIFTPLDMRNSFVDVGAARQAGLAPGHNVWFGLTLPSLYRHEPDRLPTASIITTTNDLARFVASHLGQGPSVLTPESLSTAHRGAAPAGSFSYAMGWREGDTAGVPSLWHGGALPSYRGAVVMLPGTNTGVIVLTNTSTMFADHTREIASGIVAILHGREPPAGGRSLRSIYTWIAIIAGVILVLQLWSFVRALRAPASRGALVKIAVLDLVLPAAVLIFLPRVVKIPWRAMFEGVPDVVSALLLVLVLSLVAGVAKLRAAQNVKSKK